MKAVVVYESFWGNTAAVARAIAEGIGQGAKALSTAEADSTALAGVDLLVAGAPVIAFGLCSDSTRPKASQVKPGDPKPDTANPTMRSWLRGLSKGQGIAAAFQTRMRIPLPNSSAKTIARALAALGYRVDAKPASFFAVSVFPAPLGPMIRMGALERMGL